MIVDRLAYLDRYEGMHPRFGEAFRLLREVLEKKAAPGRYEGREAGVFANVSRYETKPFEDAAMEAHRTYIDLQVVTEGEELLLVPAEQTGRITSPYDAERDYEGAEVPAACHCAALSGGSFAILFPEEQHAPGIAVSRPAAVSKIVVKILL